MGTRLCDWPQELPPFRPAFFFTNVPSDATNVFRFIEFLSRRAVKAALCEKYTHPTMRIGVDFNEMGTILYAMVVFLVLLCGDNWHSRLIIDKFAPPKCIEDGVMHFTLKPEKKRQIKPYRFIRWDQEPISSREWLSKYANNTAGINV